jgi:hypothetical protein
MFDLVADYPRGNSKLPSVHQKCIPTELEGWPMVQVSTEEEALLIMRRLVDAYLARRPVRSKRRPFPAADTGMPDKLSMLSFAGR